MTEIDCNGVKLTTEGSGVLEILQEYEQAGMHIPVCGTCLNHFDLLDKKSIYQFDIYQRLTMLR